MTIRPDNTLISNREMFVELAEKVVAPLARLITSSPLYAAVETLNRTSDAELAAKGLTRAQAAEQLFRQDG